MTFQFRSSVFVAWLWRFGAISCGRGLMRINHDRLSRKRTAPIVLEGERMSDETNEPPTREQRVNEAIAAYLEAVDAGEAPDPKEFIAANSEIAPELDSFFANRDEFDRMAEPLQPACPAAPDAQHDDVTLPPAGEPIETPTIAPTLAPTESADAANGTMMRYFGDYELLEEIARGGMGVVYKARQVSLNRIVALKMILAGQLASEEHVQRFHAEVEAAANLDHPGIVPIFEVGEHEGQHYFPWRLLPHGVWRRWFLQ